MPDPTTDPTVLVRVRWEIRPDDGGPPIYCELRAPKGPPPRTAVILCHGFKGFKDWGFFPALARRIARSGHAAITFNLSGSGAGRDGDITELDRFAAATHSRDLDEIRMVLDAVHNGALFPDPPLGIGLFGHSRGGGEAILAAGEDHRVTTLVTWAAIAAVERWNPVQVAAWERGETIHIENSRTHQQLPIAPGYWADIQQNQERLDILGAASRLEIPWLIVHGEADQSVDVGEAHALFDAAGDEAEMLLVADAGHTFGGTHPLVATAPELLTAAHATVSWFDRHLPGRVDFG